MAPKPFPYPIGVGVDVCHIPRLYKVIGKPSVYVTRWAKKIFTRLEWPHLWQKFYETNAQPSTSQTSEAQLWIPKVQCTTTRTQTTHPAPSVAEASHLWRNKVTQHEVEAHDETQSPGIPFIEKLAGNGHIDTVVPSLDTPTHHVKLLAQYLAGRWAAKEAAIKAHRNRRLSLNDISILQPEPSGTGRSELSTNSRKVYALITPETTTKVVMQSQVAKSRGLLETQSRFSYVYGDVAGSQFVKMAEPNNDNVLTAESGRKLWVRGLRAQDEEQQIAEINISHDHDYAVAVCMALDEKTTPRGSVDYIVDDGSGEPIHEPEWGDEGWLGGTPAISSSDR
ncbi:MAG: hypothetical protein Q9216_002750 [Gyalolechia sp. 2 TL-2023]